MHLRCCRNTIAGLLTLLTLATAGCGRPLRFPLTAGAAFEFSAYFQEDISGAARAALTAGRQLIRTVYPVWYDVDASGDIIDLGYDAHLQREAVEAGMAVVPVVRNRFVSGSDPAALLRNRGTARSVAARLASLAANRGFQGLNVDFAGLPADAGDELLAFCRDLWRRLHGLGKRMVITVPARPDRGAAEVAAYDCRQLARVADFVILAAYDHSSAITAPGPVAPLTWVERSIADITRVVPARKVILAVGTYGYDWPNGGPGLPAVVSAAGAYQLASQVGASVNFDATAHEETFSYSQDGLNRVVWFGDRRSVGERIALARSRGLYGVVCWRLGQEEPGFWDGVRQVLRGK